MYLTTKFIANLKHSLFLNVNVVINIFRNYCHFNTFVSCTSFTSKYMYLFELTLKKMYYYIVTQKWYLKYLNWAKNNYFGIFCLHKSVYLNIKYT